MMRIATGIMAGLMVAIAGYAGTAEKPAGRVAMPVVKIERGEKCVAPVEDMRRNHMKMLLHQRDRTVHQGVRETRFSLKGCIDCHASQETGSVIGKEGFCTSCHTYASVKIDCFECHTPMQQNRTAGAQR